VSSLTIGRLLLATPVTWQEQVGSPVSQQGGTVVPNTRTPLQYQLQISTTAADGQTDTQAARLTIRRQLRSLLNNDPLKYQYAYLYIQYSDDPEQNGWFVPDQASLQDIAQSVGLATGWWNLQTNWFLTGHRRTHREARQVWMKDLRTGLYQRDFRGWIFSTDFSALPALQVTVLPAGVSSAIQAVSGQVIAGAPMPAGRDGGACQVVQGLSDLAVISYERPEASLNLSDVIAYDRMGQITAPSTGPDTSWVELYGPDWPYNWQTSGQPADTPVLDNGLVRLRFGVSDGQQGEPGFWIDLWNGSAYSTQGKMYIRRVGDVSGYCNTFVSSQLIEWTPDRAVIEVVLSNSADAYSRECVYVTVQRGEIGAAFECYPALKSTGAQADCQFIWQAFAATEDANDTAVKVDSQTLPSPTGAAAIQATAGSGSASFAGGVIGNANFTTSENWVVLLRYPTTFNVIAPYQATFSLLQGANAQAATGSGNYIEIVSQNGAGYLQTQVMFSATASDQVNEAETIRNTGSGTTSQVSDATASGGLAVKDTQTTEANATVSKNTNLLQAKYRMIARVKVDSGATGSFRFVLNGVNGSVVTSTSTSWTWIDLGEIASTVAGPNYHVNAWRSAGASGGVYIDRVELVLVEDRTRGTAIFSGARDQAQAALEDSRALGAIVVRG
jgi:hypothetical protein